MTNKILESLLRGSKGYGIKHNWSYTTRTVMRGKVLLVQFDKALKHSLKCCEITQTKLRV